MRIYLLTSNKYNKLCPINIHFLNKYWPGQDITLVGYEKVLELTDLPDNVTVCSVGIQENFGKMWTNALIPFFRDVEEDYFTIILEDQVLAKPVDQSQMDLLETYFKYAQAEKAQIGGGIEFASGTRIGNNLVEIKQDVAYRTSLHPAIWKKSYFLKYLNPHMTSWDFELVNDARHDKARILNFDYDYPNEPHPYCNVELYNKGEITINSAGVTVTNQPSKNFFKQEDLKYMWDEIHK